MSAELRDDDFEEEGSVGIALLGKAETLKVIDKATAELAGKMILEAKDELRRITEFFRPLKQSADAHKRTLLDSERKEKAPAEATIEILDPQLVAWERQQYAAQKALEQRAAEEAAAINASLPPGSMPVVVPAPAVEKPAVDGLAFRSTWKCRLNARMRPDEAMKALCRAVADGKVTVSIMSVEWPVANDLARANKANLDIPGLEAYEDRSTAAKRK